MSICNHGLPDGECSMCQADSSVTGWYMDYSKEELVQKLLATQDQLLHVTTELAEARALLSKAYQAGQDSVGYRSDGLSRLDGNFDTWLEMKQKQESDGRKS